MRAPDRAYGIYVDSCNEMVIGEKNRFVDKLLIITPTYCLSGAARLYNMTRQIR